MGERLVTARPSLPHAAATTTARMKFLDRLERAFAPLAIPHLALYLVLGQVTMLGLELLGGISLEPLAFVPQAVLAGEWWRIFTFILLPPNTSLVFIAFAWYLFWLMGNALEEHWGERTRGSTTRFQA